MKTAHAESAEMVYVVDDDASARESLCWLLNTEGIETHAFDSAESFLAAWSDQWRGCVTVDVRMPGMNGLQLQEALNSMQNLLPVIVLTGHADVPVAIRAMKLGALDFLEKPYSDSDLLSSVNTALKAGEALRRLQQEKRRIAKAVATLTSREREVMDLVVTGNTNKAIAAQLEISEKTVEIHRQRVMQKTVSGTLSELVRISLVLSD